MTHIVAYIPDLMFNLRVRDVLTQLGYQATVLDSIDQVEQHLNATTNLLIVDLRGAELDIIQLIQSAKNLAQPIPVLAFGSHVNVERQQAARAAGCDRVVANSKFSRDLPALVAQMLESESN